ncbi:MAG: Nif3-like dinuclear metal center hexameric protein [Sciscionella sp.]
MTTLREVIAVLQEAYPPALAQPWDAVGLVCGDRREPVRKVLVCVDADESTVDEAIDGGADLLLAHHPLLLRGVHGVPADEPKGALVHRMIRCGTAMFCAHTNADAADPGVSDALACAVGLQVTGLLDPGQDGRTGIGRVGVLDTVITLAEFTDRVATSLPATAWGVRAAGEADRPIRTVAVAGGAGDGYLDKARELGVDAFLTADLRHHPAAEHLARHRAPALIDVAHWASEWPWCEQAAGILRAALDGTVEVLVSTRRTDPWTMHAIGATTTPHGRAQG